MRSSLELLTAATAMACMTYAAACGQTVETEGTVTGFDQRERVTVEAARWVQVNDDSWPPQYGTEYRNLHKETEVDCNPVDDNQFKSSDDRECRRDPSCFAGIGKHCEVVDTNEVYDYEKKVWEELGVCEPQPRKHSLQPDLRRDIDCVDELTRYRRAELRFERATRFIVYVSYQAGKEGEPQTTKEQPGPVKNRDSWMSLENGSRVKVHLRGNQVTSVSV